MADHFAFIVSGGRTGTQFLGDLLSEAIEDSYSEHEPDIIHGFDRGSLERLRRFGLWHMVVGRALGQSGVRVLGTRHLVGKDDLTATMRKLRAQRKAYHAGIEQSLVIESYYAWWMVASHLPAIFSEAKAVGIVRDPRHWIASWLKRTAKRADGHWTQLLPPGPLTPARLGDTRWADEWESMSPVGKLAWQWQLINGTILRATDDGVLDLFRFEDVFNPDTGEFDRLVDTISTFPDRQYSTRDISEKLSQKRNASSAQGDDWESWTGADKQLVNDICGPVMDACDYRPL